MSDFEDWMNAGILLFTPFDENDMQSAFNAGMKRAAEIVEKEDIEFTTKGVAAAIRKEIK